MSLTTIAIARTYVGRSLLIVTFILHVSNQMHERTIILHLLICLLYPLQCDIISLTDLKIMEAIHLLPFLQKWRFNFQILGFRYFKFLFIYE